MILISANKPFHSSLIHFIFDLNSNRKLLAIAILSSILQLIIFKLMYPFADYFSDSSSYVFAASANLDINIWPIGYSKFLIAFHGITHSDTAVVAFQYFFLELSVLYLYFSLLYFYSLSNTSRIILYIFFFFNPLFLYIANYINSDPLFAALSVLWLTQLIWTINKPNLYQLLFHGILLFFCFTVRNNAYYYPLVSLIALLVSAQRPLYKLAGIGLPFILILAFILHTRSAAKDLTGKAQFSLFSGWQIANNSLYMYDKIKFDTTNHANAELTELAKLSDNFSRTAPTDLRDMLFDYPGNYFIKSSHSPLKIFWESQYHPTTSLGQVETWGKASIIYSDFGKSLIIAHPFEYFECFLLLNTKNYFFPVLEKLEIYNTGSEQVDRTVQDWFDYPTPNVYSISKTLQGNLLAIFPFIFLFLNVFSIGTILWLFFKRKQIKPDQKTIKIIIILGSLLVLNALFSILATIIVFRYEFFPMLVMLPFSLLIFESIDKKEKEARATSINQLPNLPALDLA